MQRLRNKYADYLIAHRDSGMKLSPITIDQVDEWHAELERISTEEYKAKYTDTIDLDALNNLRKAC